MISKHFDVDLPKHISSPGFVPLTPSLKDGELDLENLIIFVVLWNK